MATQDKVLVLINQNLPSTPEMAYQIQQSIVSKFNVDATVIPNFKDGKPVEATSETLDEQTLISIEGESTVLLMSLIEGKI